MPMKKTSIFCLLFLVCKLPLFSGETPPPKNESSRDLNKKDLVEFQWTVEAKKEHTLVTQEGNFPYEVRLDSLKIPSKNENNFAEIYFTSYFGTPLSESRPILFCFNGGPGSSSVWLHMGLLGPKRLQFPPLLTSESHKGELKDNRNSLLQYADLVFIDPLATGLSRFSQESNAKDFLGVDEDISYFAICIERYLSHFKRWNSPKYLLGESYGTLRAVLLARELHSSHYFDVDGLILISLALDLNLLSPSDPFNELALVASLPSLALFSQHHGLLSQDLRDMHPLEVYNAAKQFAKEEWAPALLLGPSLSQKQKEIVAGRLSSFTGIPTSSLLRSHLRVTMKDCKEWLLQQKNIAAGRFDIRVGAYVPYKEENEFDPSFSFMVNDFTRAINVFLTQDLGLDEKHPYVILNGQANQNWNWISEKRPGFHPLSSNGTASLEDLMCKIPSLRVYHAIGLFDAATPPLSQEITLSRLSSEHKASRVRSDFFEGGHMMYLDNKNYELLNTHLKEFIMQK